MKKTYLASMLCLFSTIIGYTQSFSIDTVFEIKELNENISYNHSNRLLTQDGSTIIPLIPEFEQNTSNIQLFVYIDTVLQTKILKWECDTLQYYGNIYCYGGGLIKDNKYIFYCHNYIYLTKLQDERFISLKRIKYKKSEYFSGIYPIKNSINKFLLYNTYNNPITNVFPDIFRIAILNIKTRLVEKIREVPVEKGSLFSHYGYNLIVNSEDKIAVAHPTKPEFYIYNNELDIIDTVCINYPDINNTNKLIDSTFSDEYLKQNRFDPISSYITKINEEFLYLSKARIHKISFLTNDKLLIHIYPNNNNKLDSIIHFVYSIKEKKFDNDKGTANQFGLMDGDDKNIWYNNKSIVLEYRMIDDETIRYCANLIIYNKQEDYILKLPLDTSLLKKIIESNYKDSIQINFADFNNIAIFNILSCSKCNFLHLKKILVIHVYDGEITPYDRFINKKKYNRIFDKPTILFIKKSEQTNKFKINTIYSVK